MTRHTVGDLQHAIMTVLWERGECASTDVHAALLPLRGLAPTTISTMLRKMEDRGLVTHRNEGRQFIYRPAVTRRQVQVSMVGELVERLFAGDPAALVSHLIHEHGIDADEIDRLEQNLQKQLATEED